MTAPRKGAMLAELVLVCLGVAALVALGRSLGDGVGAGLIGVAWIAGAMAGPLLRDDDLSRVGLERIAWGRSLLWAVAAALVFIPLGYLGLVLVAAVGWPLPQPGAADGWLWAAGQLLAIAVPEELFFRGYVQGTLSALLARSHPGWWRPAAVLLASAALFAGAHVLFFGRLAPALVFFPGLAMAWLRWRTGSPVAAGLFHAAANISYPFLWRAVAA